MEPCMGDEIFTERYEEDSIIDADPIMMLPVVL